MLFENLPEEMVKSSDDRWYKCRPFVISSRGGRTVIFADENGIERKREAFTKYKNRIVSSLEFEDDLKV